MDKSGPLAKLESVVIESLIQQGMSRGEAMAVVERLEAAGAKIHSTPVDTHDPEGNFVSFSNVHCKAETSKALLCIIGELEIWIPTSQIADDSEVSMKGDYGILMVTRWIAQQKDLI